MRQGDLRGQGTPGTTARGRHAHQGGEGRASVGARRFVMGDRMASLKAVKRRMVLRISGGFSSSVQ
jgi:hypothetical protein